MSEHAYDSTMIPVILDKVIIIAAVVLSLKMIMLISFLT